MLTIMGSDSYSDLEAIKRHIKSKDDFVGKHFSFFYRLKAEWLTIISLIADGFALITIIWNAYSPASPYTSRELLPIIAILILLLIFFILLIEQEFRYSRKARYAEAIVYMHSIIHRLRDNFHTLNKIDSSPPETRQEYIDKARIEMIAVITSFANAFTLITGAKCRSCIKLLQLDETKVLDKLNEDEKKQVFYVKTWARDADSMLSQEIQTEGEPLHWVYENTDFTFLFETKSPAKDNYFFSNDLTDEYGYNNTSFQLYGKPEFVNVLRIKKVKKWPLPYRSTIVWPIRRITDIKHDQEKDQFLAKQDAIGYLCIDSYARGVFNRRYDFHLGALVADAIFIYLRRYLIVIKKEVL